MFLIFLFNFLFNNNRLWKQNSPRGDVAFCGVSSGAVLLAYVPYYRYQVYMTFDSSVYVKKRLHSHSLIHNEI